MEKQKNTLQRLNSLITKNTRTFAQKPALFTIVLLNDDTTPIAAVQELIASHFYQTEEAACLIAEQAHEQGEAILGTYTREIAETKIAEIIEDARSKSHPLKCVMRKVR